MAVKLDKSAISGSGVEYWPYGLVLYSPTLVDRHTTGNHEFFDGIDSWPSYPAVQQFSGSATAPGQDSAQ